MFNPYRARTHQFKGIDIHRLHIGGRDGFRFRFCFRPGLRRSLSHRRRNNRSLVQLQLCGNPIGFHGGGFRQVNFYQAGLTSQQLVYTDAQGRPE